MNNKYGIALKDGKRIIELRQFLRSLDEAEIAKFALELALDYIQDFRDMAELETPEQALEWLYNRDSVFNSVFTKHKEAHDEKIKRV